MLKMEALVKKSLQKQVDSARECEMKENDENNRV